MIAAVLYIVGAGLVFAAAFMPLSLRVYGKASAAAAAAAEAAPHAWRWHHALFALGASTTALAAFWEAVGSGRAALVGAAVGFVLGAVFFLLFLSTRVSTPPRRWFSGTVGRKRFFAFTSLTILGLLLRGVAAVQAGAPTGWAFVAFALLLAVLYAWMRDMPPFAHYVGTLGLGIALWL